MNKILNYAEGVMLTNDVDTKKGLVKFYYARFDSPDANNRLIIECFYYGKEVKLIRTEQPIDSAVMRYTDGKTKGILSYHLTDNDEIIKDMLG